MIVRKNILFSDDSRTPQRVCSLTGSRVRYKPRRNTHAFVESSSLA